MNRDEQRSSPPKRQPRFTPKAPSRRKLKPINPKREEEDNDEAADEDAKALLQRLNDLGKRGSKVEKKSLVQVAFANGVASSGQIRSFGVPRQGNNITTNISGSNSKNATDNDGKIISHSPSTAIQDVINSSVNVVESSYKNKQEFKEHWDYNHSYYPTTLPLRPPYSGDPELLDEREFGESTFDLEYDESAVNSASELGLLEENEKAQMLFLQLPTTLPLEKRSATTTQKEKGKEIVGEIFHSWENMSKGDIGKLMIYKSGAIKWKIGEIIYDVAPGVSCNFAQEIVAFNTAEKNVCALREVGKRAVISPDIDSLFNLDLDSC